MSPQLSVSRPTDLHQSLETELLRVDGVRLNAGLDRMAAIGTNPDGSVCRRGFTEQDVEARILLSGWMKDAGLKVRIDTAGNLIGRLEGAVPGLPALVTGSHIDTVPTGGRYDGVLGVLAGLEIARTLHCSGRSLQHPFEVIAFADEESTMVGCKGMSGTASCDPSSFVTSNGKPIQDNLLMIGGDWSNLASARRSDDAIAAFVELHVEQGGVLEQRGDVIGTVDGVVGQKRFTVVIEGQANHAGTTPMNDRLDALAAAARVVLAVEQMAVEHPGDPVATVGRLQVWPNAANVVPGSVQLTVDLRDLDSSVLDQLSNTLMNALERIGESSGCAIRLDPQFDVAPTPADQTVKQAITASAGALGLKTSSLPSRASHDAQEIGRRWPMGMIFVPSRDGLSHSAGEFTEASHCEAGTQVLLDTLLRLDRTL